jgi:hypothetical protein
MNHKVNYNKKLTTEKRANHEHKRKLTYLFTQNTGQLVGQKCKDRNCLSTFYSMNTDGPTDHTDTLPCT